LGSGERATGRPSARSPQRGQRMSPASVTAPPCREGIGLRDGCDHETRPTFLVATNAGSMIRRTRWPTGRNPRPSQKDRDRGITWPAMPSRCGLCCRTTFPMAWWCRRYMTSLGWTSGTRDREGSGSICHRRQRPRSTARQPTRATQRHRPPRRRPQASAGRGPAVIRDGRVGRTRLAPTTLMSQVRRTVTAPDGCLGEPGNLSEITGGGHRRQGIVERAAEADPRREPVVGSPRPWFALRSSRA
jgi:hypothetical protein